MKEYKLRNLINKTIKENYINEVGFLSGLKSKVSGWLSGGKNKNPQAINYNAPIKKSKNADFIFPKDIDKYKTIKVGNNEVPTDMINFRLVNVFFEKVNNQLQRKKNSVASWLFKKDVYFTLKEPLSLNVEADKQKLKTTDIIFTGIWISGEFKGYFEEGIFNGGTFNGGKYMEKSANFMPKRPLSQKLNAFKSGGWFSLDGLFGLNYLKTSKSVESCHMLQLKNNSYIIFDTDKGIFKVTVLKQIYGNDFNFEYSATKYNPSTKKYLKYKRVPGNLEDIKLNPEVYNITKKIGGNLFFEDNIKINSIVKVRS